MRITWAVNRITNRKTHIAIWSGKVAANVFYILWAKVGGSRILLENIHPSLCQLCQVPRFKRWYWSWSDPYLHGLIHSQCTALSNWSFMPQRSKIRLYHPKETVVSPRRWFSKNRCWWRLATRAHRFFHFLYQRERCSISASEIEMRIAKCGVSFVKKLSVAFRIYLFVWFFNRCIYLPTQQLRKR